PRLGVKHRWVAVRVEQRVGERPGGQPVDLGENAAGGIGVDLGERRRAEALVQPEDLEEHELEVAEIAPVVTHRRCTPGGPTGYSPVTSTILLISNVGKWVHRSGSPSGVCRVPALGRSKATGRRSGRSSSEVVLTMGLPLRAAHIAPRVTTGA